MIKKLPLVDIAIMLFIVIIAALIGFRPITSNIIKPKPKIVSIECNENQSNGSGFFISPVHIVTAYHVIEHCSALPSLRLNNASAKSIVYENREEDVVVLETTIPTIQSNVIDIDCDPVKENANILMRGIIKHSVVSTDITATVVIPNWFGQYREKLDNLCRNPVPPFTAIANKGIFVGMSGGPAVDIETGKAIGWLVYAADPDQVHSYAGIGTFEHVCVSKLLQNVKSTKTP